MKSDLDNEERIAFFVDAFYEKVLADSTLAPIFLDVAAVDLSKHLPLIRAYWAKLLLGDSSYRRHTMNIHRALHSKQKLTEEDFSAWLHLFCTTVDQHYCGPVAERAKRVSRTIAGNMSVAVGS